MVLSLVYLLFRRALAVAALRLRSREFEELEIVVLRHELAVLRPRVKGVKTTFRPEEAWQRCDLAAIGRFACEVPKLRFHLQITRFLQSGRVYEPYAPRRASITGGTLASRP